MKFNMILGLHPVDLIVLIIFFIGITILGVWTVRGVKDLESFIMPKKFGKLFMLFFNFGTGTHADQAVGVAAKSFTNGLSGIWYQWVWLFVSPFYWLIAPVMRRFRANTTADIFEARFDRSVALLFAAVGVGLLMVDLGVMLKTAGVIMDGATAGRVSSGWAIIIMTVCFLIYGLAGGLSAAIVTDLVQGVLTIVFSFILLPFILHAVGGWDSLLTQLRPEQTSLVAPTEIGLFYILIVAFNALVGNITQPTVLANCAAGRTEMDGRVGYMGGSLVKRVCTIPWALTGLAAIAYFGTTPVEPDLVWGRVANEFLPIMMPGLIGIFLAALFASTMSVCSALMIVASGLFTENLYRRMVRQRTERHYVQVARLASFGIVVGGVIFAFVIPTVIKGIELLWIIPTMMGIAFWLGLFWRRATVAGAWAATVVGFVAWWITTQAFFVDYLAVSDMGQRLRFVSPRNGVSEIYLPWQMLFYLGAGGLAGVLFSLFSRPTSEEKLDRFYELVSTPIVPGEIIRKPCELPPEVRPRPMHKLIPLRNWMIPVPSAVSLAGFVVGWIFVSLLIMFVYWIA